MAQNEPVDLGQEVALPEPRQLTVADFAPTGDKLVEIKQKAKDWADRIAAVHPHSPEHREVMELIRAQGRTKSDSVIMNSERFSNQSFASSKSEGASEAQMDVSQSIMDLRNTIVNLTPKERNALQRVLATLPGKKKVDTFLTRYQSSKSLLNDIDLQLLRGRNQLDLDSAELELAAAEAWEEIKELVHASFVLGELRAAVAESKQADPNTLFEVTQRHLDIESKIETFMRAFMASGAIIEVNRTLSRLVDRSRETLMLELKTSVVIARALDSQRRVNDGVQAIRQTASDLAVSTSQGLKDNATAVYEEAAKPTLTPEALRKSQANIAAAFDQVESFMERSIPLMAESISILQEQRASLEEPMRELHARQAGESEIASGRSRRQLR